MTIDLVNEELHALLEQKKLPEMVDVMVRFCASRGYVPRRRSTEEMVISFFSGQCIDPLSLIHEYGMARMQALLFQCDLRLFRYFNGI